MSLTLIAGILQWKVGSPGGLAVITGFWLCLLAAARPGQWLGRR